MIFISTLTFVILRDSALVLLMLGAVELYRRYRAGEPMPFFGEQK